MKFTTDDIDRLQMMVEHAVKNGLLFNSYVLNGEYVIEYTGGF